VKRAKKRAKPCPRAPEAITDDSLARVIAQGLAAKALCELRKRNEEVRQSFPVVTEAITKSWLGEVEPDSKAIIERHLAEAWSEIEQHFEEKVLNLEAR
jgi:hypothetical protein